MDNVPSCKVKQKRLKRRAVWEELVQRFDLFPHPVAILRIAQRYGKQIPTGVSNLKTVLDEELREDPFWPEGGVSLNALQKLLSGLGSRYRISYSFMINCAV